MNNPTYFYLSVDYTDGLTGQAAADSYRGVKLRIEFGSTISTTTTFNTHDFVQDYADAVSKVQELDAGRALPFMASSSLDSYMFDAGYVEVEA